MLMVLRSFKTLIKDYMHMNNMILDVLSTMQLVQEYTVMFLDRVWLLFTATTVLTT